MLLHLLNLTHQQKAQKKTPVKYTLEGGAIFDDGIFDPESLNSPCFFDPGIADLSLPPLPDYFEGLCLFVRLHLLSFLSVPLYGPLKFIPPQVHLSYHIGIGANSPAGEGFGQEVTF